MRKKIDWVSVWIILGCFGLLSAIALGIAFEVLKFVAVVKYVFS